MPEFKVIDVPSDEDLSQFSRFLWHKGVSHRIVTVDNRQLLLVGREQDALKVYNAYQSSSTQGEVIWVDEPADEDADESIKPSLFAYSPVTLGTTVLSILGYFICSLDRYLGFLEHLTFFKYEAIGTYLWYNNSIIQGEYWRLITPIFLHFTILHIVFNMLWLWDFGRRIEKRQGSFKLLGLILVIGLSSNIVQSMFGVSRFGGMSGVIYGLLGYAWIWSLLVPDRSFGIPAVIIAFMLAWLVLCFFGIATLLGAGDVANAAHLSGLIVGMIMGLGAAMIARFERR